MTEVNKCSPPTVGFTIDGKEYESINVDLSKETIKMISYNEALRRQRKIKNILKSKTIDGKLMRFRKSWRCSIGWHSWYCFRGYYSVCDNCGIIQKEKRKERN